MSDKDRPTPYTAVALHYDGKEAPRVTAKGHGEVAKQILVMAQAHDIPLHADPALAGLLSQVEIGKEIPPALYVAVAHVIAFAYFLSGKKPNFQEGDCGDGGLKIFYQDL